MQVWHPNERNMVGCDNCSFWVHVHCDPVAQRVLHQMERGHEEAPYMCPLCCRQEEARTMLAALATADAAMKAAMPRNPRSAYNLFSMEIHKCAAALGQLPMSLLPYWIWSLLEQWQ